MEQQRKRNNNNLIMIISLFIIIIVVAIIIAVGGTAKSVTRTLKEQTEANIKFDNNKINVYLFYGDGCPHCEELIRFLNSLPDKYNSYYDLYTLEVWYNEKNSQLMKELVGQLGKEVKGLPCLIIGNQVLFGYSESMNEKIKKAIKEEYLKADRYDVYKNYK